MDDYIKSILPIRNSGFMGDLRDFCLKYRVPIIRDDVAQLINILIRTLKPVKILEVGTAVGFSALVMAEALKCTARSGHIDTVEINPDMTLAAKENFVKAGAAEIIRVITGDALEVLPCLNTDYDFIFIDGAKGHYINLYNDIKRLLKPGGLLVCDNVFYQGKIFKSPQDTPRKHRTIVANMRSFLEILCSDNELETTILQAGDGISLSYRKEKQ